MPAYAQPISPQLRPSPVRNRRERFTKEQFMSKLPKPTEQEISEGPQSVSFQIANGNARQGCILQTNFPTKVQAQKYLLTNWPIIEKMACGGNL